MPIELSDATITKVRWRTTTSDGVRLFIDVSDEGLAFFVTESSSGASHDKPVRRSPDEVWAWIKNESGGRVKLEHRAEVTRAIQQTAKKAKSSSADPRATS